LQLIVDGRQPSFSCYGLFVFRQLDDSKSRAVLACQFGENLIVRNVTVALAAAALPLFAVGGAAQAQDKPLAIELNKTSDAGAGCRLTFVATNGAGVALDKASYEIAVFDARKQVAKLLIFEFGRLPIGKTRVVEFEFADLGCKDISRVLVNTSTECVSGGQDTQICLDNLQTSSLSEIAFDQ
jgi:hypothetical protein